MDIDQLLDIFYAEAFERLDDLERGLVQLESDPGNNEVLDEVFRAAHTLKGSAGLAGLNAISKMAHVMEDLLDEVRQGARSFTTDLSSLLLRATDVLKQIVQVHAETHQETLPADFAPTLKLLVDVAGLEMSEDKAPEQATEAVSQEGELFRISLKFKPELFETGQDPLLLLLELAELGELQEVRCHAEVLPPLPELDPTKLYLSWDVVFRTTAGEEAVRDVFLFVQYDGEVAVERVVAPENAREEQTAKPESQQDRSGVEEETAGTDTPQAKPAASGTGSGGVRSKTSGGVLRAGTVRVRTEKLDRMVDLSGEVAIQLGQLEATLRNLAGTSTLQDSGVQAVLEALGRVVSRLQSEALGLRMVPVEESLARFTRLVRDAAVETGKEVELIIEGGETELDRTLLAELADPIKHLLRNAVDHGVEPPEERRRLGKPLPARVWLRAYERAGRVFLEIEDDGRGLDSDRIRQRARELGLDPATNNELLAVLFRAGFSTAERVTNLSGRGVGLDVVKTAVERIGGHISVFTEKGKGTRFRISLPLTLAVLDGLLVRMGSGLCVLPLQAVLETVAWSSLEAVEIGERALVHYRGRFVPVVWLHEFSTFAGLRVQKPQVGVLVQGDGHELFLPVEEIVGSQQVVVKSLEKNWKRVPGVTGATVLGDGSLALILDASGIERLALGDSARETAEQTSVQVPVA